ncbi:unnamed protein product [Ectocarpus sp. 8 AP-2014]
MSAGPFLNAHKIERGGGHKKTKRAAATPSIPTYFVHFSPCACTKNLRCCSLAASSFLVLGIIRTVGLRGGEGRGPRGGPATTGPPPALGAPGAPAAPEEGKPGEQPLEELIEDADVVEAHPLLAHVVQESEGDVVLSRTLAPVVIQTASCDLFVAL